jgi:hypothetical protein
MAETIEWGIYIRGGRVVNGPRWGGLHNSNCDSFVGLHTLEARNGIDDTRKYKISQGKYWKKVKF